MTCQCTEPPLSDLAIEGWFEAALHILTANLIPQLPLEVRRAMARRGGRYRLLAEMVHEAMGGEVT